MQSRMAGGVLMEVFTPIVHCGLLLTLFKGFAIDMMLMTYLFAASR